MSTRNPIVIACAGKQILPGIASHGQSRTRLYRAWDNMKSRCCNPNANAYQHYGGRGISVCSEWQSDFVAFREWSLANGYADSLEIDRIDNDKGYCPENCRWATHAEQTRNMRKCVHLTAFGETKTIREWSRDPRCEVTFPAIRTRLKLGWSEQDAVGKPRSKSHVNNPAGRGGFTAKK